MMSAEDISDLEKALSIGSFERSIAGSILERARLFSVVDHHVREEDITARPTAEVRYSAKEEPDSKLLEVYGRASRKLNRLAQVDPTGAAALVAYHGDAGSRWGRGEFGRIGSVLHLTSAGRELSRRRCSGAKLDLTPDQRIENEVRLHRHKPNDARDALITRAIDEGEKLLARAVARWSEVNP